MTRVDQGGQFVRFLLVGAVNTAFSYGLFAGLVWSGTSPETSLLIAYAVGILFNYVTTGRLVFRHSGSGRLARFVVAYGVIYVFNLGVFQAVSSLGTTPYATQAISLPVVAVFSYLVFKFRVFKPVE